MATTIALDEYLSEIREQVCSRCVERPPGGPPCEPLGKVCGVERHLPALIEAIHDVKSPWIHHYLEHNRQAVCEQCAFYHNTAVCPCPMDELVFLIVKAVDTVDERRGAAAVPAEDADDHAVAPDLAEIVRVYEQTAGRWTGCDWPTAFGTMDLDLNGITAAQAGARAAVDTPLARDWHEAALWLGRVERYAWEAERAAAAAVGAARADAWSDAERHAERAGMMEFITGRPLRCRPAQSWRVFYKVVRAAARTRQGAVTPHAMHPAGAPGVEHRN
jgi:hypothetical protein